jgi:hypothetical protein
MISAVDTNVLLDLLIPNAQYVDHSLASLTQAAEEGSIIISEADHSGSRVLPEVF